MIPPSPETISQVAEFFGRFAGWYSRSYDRPQVAGSQAGEDAILANLLPEANGVYVDIGAGDPISCSNTWTLWQRGWRGLLIEPRKDALYKLCLQRHGDYVYPVGAGAQNGWSMLRLSGCVSSFEADANIQELAQSFCPVETVASILAKFPGIAEKCLFCSLDVEGHEREVLQGIDWSTFKPRVFCVEYAVFGMSAPNNDSTEKWEPLLLAQGYKLRESTGLNKIYSLG